MTSMIRVGMNSYSLQPETFEECYKVIAALSDFCEELQRAVEALSNENVILKKENSGLKEKLNAISNNPSESFIG